MRHPLSCVLLFVCTLLPAQDPPPAAPAAPAPANSANELAAAKARLQQALHKTVGRTNTAFAADWGLNGQGAEQARFAAMNGVPAASKASGSWHTGRVHVAFDGEQSDELITALRTIARDANTDWKLRQGRFADGNQIPFTPDAALLLQHLATLDLAVTHRAVGALDTQPVEILTLTLTQEQLAEAVFSGVLPSGLTTGARFQLVQMLGRQMQRQAAPPPEATVDLVAYVDPATDLVHKLHFRMWSKSMIDGRGGRQAVFVQGGMVQVTVGGGRADEKDEQEPADKNAELLDGSRLDAEHLPKRPSKDMMVSDYTVRFTDHGTKAPPPLSDEQKKLLGL